MHHFVGDTDYNDTMGGSIKTLQKNTPKATVSPTVVDLAWAAGFLEGEGCFRFYESSRIRLTASQVNREPLDQLQSLFGGGIHWERTGERWNWGLYGTRARGAMLTLYTFLSTKRKAEIRDALNDINRGRLREYQCSETDRQRARDGLRRRKGTVSV